MMKIMILLSVVKFYKPILTKYYVLDILETNNIVDLLAEYLIFQKSSQADTKIYRSKIKRTIIL